jgi:hypothetical protein
MTRARTNEESATIRLYSTTGLAIRLGRALFAIIAVQFGVALLIGSSALPAVAADGMYQRGR